VERERRIRLCDTGWYRKCSARLEYVVYQFYYRNCINAQPRERYCEFRRKVWCPVLVLLCRFLTLGKNRTENGKQPYIRCLSYIQHRLQWAPLRCSRRQRYSHPNSTRKKQGRTG